MNDEIDYLSITKPVQDMTREEMVTYLIRSRYRLPGRTRYLVDKTNAKAPNIARIF